MNDEQIIIINYLKTTPDAWFGKKEIARRAVKRRTFDDHPRWADEPLVQLIPQQVLEENKERQTEKVGF